MSDHTLQELKAELAHVKDRLQDARTATLNTEQKLNSALALLNETDAALQAARKPVDDFAWSVERGGHVLERNLTKLLHKRCQQYEADLERVQTEAAAMRKVLEGLHCWWYVKQSETDGRIHISPEEVGKHVFAASLVLGKK